MVEMMNEKQKSINRAYSDTIDEALKKSYEACQEERGELFLELKENYF